MRRPSAEDVTAILLITFGGMVSTGLTTALLLREPPAPATRPVPVVTVVVASHDLGAGRVLTAADVTVVKWPGKAAPVEFARTVESVVGLQVRRSIAMNEPIRPYEMGVRIGRTSVQVREPGVRKSSRR